MRRLLTVAVLLSTLSMAAQTEVAPETMLQRGLEHFRAERYAEAVTDLSAAAQGFLSPQEMQAYVSTGRFEKLPQFETTLIYLALAHSRLGNEREAREAVLRLATAERIEPVYSRLPLDTDAAEYESLAARLVPDIDLVTNAQLARAGAAATPQPVMAEPERLRLVEQMVAQACARIQREADEKVAAIRREADERVAAAERAAEQRIAEIQRAADQRVAAAERAVREPVRPPAPVTPVPAALPGDWAGLLRRAGEFAATGRLAEAGEIYARIAMSDAPRSARAEAATGLYRTGAYRSAVEAFARLAPFARGEEDLRYYNAVSLYETGRYAEARHELSCALPFIQMTEDVIRYRTKIEQMVAWQVSLPVVEQ
ncbi:MAG TPA: hypothetical protein VNA04_16515 [Thermoanaerobaculia bacterium]|nr:hypothetical protein [Thermoanaerobaculia bacterium]